MLSPNDLRTPSSIPTKSNMLIISRFHYADPSVAVSCKCCFVIFLLASGRSTQLHPGTPSRTGRRRRDPKATSTQVPRDTLQPKRRCRPGRRGGTLPPHSTWRGPCVGTIGECSPLWNRRVHHKPNTTGAPATPRTPRKSSRLEGASKATSPIPKHLLVPGLAPRRRGAISPARTWRSVWRGRPASSCPATSGSRLRRHARRRRNRRLPAQA